MTETKAIIGMIKDLESDEKEIVDTLLGRISDGRKGYGPWDVDTDNRDYPHEALAEVIDAMHYCAAELVKLRKKQRNKRTGSRKTIYICHPFGDNPDENTVQIAIIARELLDQGLVPMAPQLFLPLLYDERTERFQALKKCKEYLQLCDEIRVYGNKITEGMRYEIMFANLFGIPLTLGYGVSA